MHKMADFVIFGLPRTGSSLLNYLLTGHPGICCDTELFHPKFWPAWQQQVYRVWRRYPYPYLAYRCWQARLSGKPHYGFKLFPRHVQSIERVLAGLSRRGWSILHIQRCDLFQQTISLLVANRTGRYNGRHTEPTPQLNFTVEEFQATLRQRQQEVQRLNHLLENFAHLDLVYEDHLADRAMWQPTMDHICNYLGIATAPVQVNYRRTWTRPYSDLISNYAELANCYKVMD